MLFANSNPQATKATASGTVRRGAVRRTRSGVVGARGRDRRFDGKVIEDQRPASSCAPGQYAASAGYGDSRVLSGKNAVDYFVSYYDYFFFFFFCFFFFFFFFFFFLCFFFFSINPEAYVAVLTTFIEKGKGQITTD